MSYRVPLRGAREATCKTVAQPVFRQRIWLTRPLGGTKGKDEHDRSYPCDPSRRVSSWYTRRRALRPGSAARHPRRGPRGHQLARMNRRHTNRTSSTSRFAAEASCSTMASVTHSPPATCFSWRPQPSIDSKTPAMTFFCGVCSTDLVEVKLPTSQVQVPPNRQLQRTLRPSLRSGRSPRPLGSPLNRGPLGPTRLGGNHDGSRVDRCRPSSSSAD